ncbi:serine hydrolase FSH [Sporodiniella umbellata]|nr:serine hydrolase FSH [Sporodiniella umbellata]
MATNKKIKILCLHGFGQNGTIFESKTAPIRKELESIADFVFITAPHCFTPDGAELQGLSEGHRMHMWWHLPAVRATQNGYYIGYKESVEYVKSVIEEQGPFDGILGFSQGCVFSALLASLLEKKTPGFNNPPLKFAVLVSGYRPVTQEQTLSLLSPENKCKTPSLHYIGDSDTQVLPRDTLELSESFQDPIVFHHPGG